MTLSGLDVHARQTHAAVVDLGSGEIAARRLVGTLEDVVAFLRTHLKRRQGSSTKAGSPHARRPLDITQRWDASARVLTTAAAEAFFSSLEWAVLRDAEFRGLEHAQAVVQEWCYGFYNHVRRHSHNLRLSPVHFEALAR